EFHGRLAGGEAFVADAAEHCLLDGAEAGSGAYATGVLERMDVLRVALLDHAASRRQQVGHKIDLLGPNRGVVEVAPHQIGLTGDDRGQEARPAAGPELERHADAGEGRPHEIGIEPDQLVEIFRVAKREGRAFAALGYPDRFADQSGIFGGERLGLALAFGGRNLAGDHHGERQYTGENRNAHCSPPVAIATDETGRDTRCRSQGRRTALYDEVAAASRVPPSRPPGAGLLRCGERSTRSPADWPSFCSGTDELP